MEVELAGNVQGTVSWMHWGLWASVTPTGITNAGPPLPGATLKQPLTRLFVLPATQSGSLLAVAVIATTAETGQFILQASMTRTEPHTGCGLISKWILARLLGPVAIAATIAFSFSLPVKSLAVWLVSISFFSCCKYVHIEVLHHIHFVHLLNSTLWSLGMGKEEEQKKRPYHSYELCSLIDEHS